MRRNWLAAVLIGVVAWAGAPPASAQVGPAASAAQSYRPVLKPYVDDYGSLFWVILGLAAGALLYLEWRRKPLAIEPFEAPKEFADAGLTGTVLARQLGDEIRRVQRQARPDDGPGDMSFVELSSMQVDLQLPGMS
jgi:hypothetical protein